MQSSNDSSYSNIPVKWSLINNIGDMTVTSGGSKAELTATNTGVGYIQIEDNGVQKRITLNILAALDNAPVSASLTPSNGYREIETIITLSYTDADSDQATGCSISGLSNLTESTACACSSGTCTVGVIGIASYTGAVSFNYTVTANSATSNQSGVNFTLNAIGASSTDEWVRIPANAGGMGLSEFYVMKYEAKAWNDGNTNSTIDGGEVDTDGTGVATGSNVPVSIADNQPWRSIDANDSAAECESLGANYHLISNPEWMAIARDIENVNANWTGGTVGTGCLFRGNSGDTTCGYNSATDPDSGTGRDARAKHSLSTGQEIFDISGNVWEWTDWDAATVGFQIGPTTCTTSAELPSVACGALADADYNTNNGGYTRTEGVGYYFGGSGGAALRGGSWDNSTLAGAFTLYLFDSPTITLTDIGFRCVFRP
ncbi:MAG: sulfatase activating formylglycine-generating enzyme [Bacteriovoracaceae bacterium]|jgi:formylglycine-generating enzyme required for sulfatase activity